MKHAKWLVPVLLMALAFPVLAGEKGHDCTSGTQECLNKMVAKMESRGWVGIEMDKSDDDGSLAITRVVADSPAEVAGFQVGDVLLAVNGAKFADDTEDTCVTCEATKKDWAPGTTVHYVVLRDGMKAKVSPTLGKLPSDVMAQWVGMHMIEHAEYTALAQK